MAQYFNGKAYWLCGRYYQRRSKRLHRVVWEHFNGPIPSGWHVHHRDGDRSNNDISNLELLSSSSHLSLHQQDRGEYQQAHIKRIRVLASEWHGSKEGRAWHAERGRENGKLPPRFPFKCFVCGADGLAKQRNRKFCSAACEQREFRRRNPGYRTRFKR